MRIGHVPVGTCFNSLSWEGDNLNYNFWSKPGMHAYCVVRMTCGTDVSTAPDAKTTFHKTIYVTNGTRKSKAFQQLLKQ
jgi:hypothetical protein